MKTIKVFALLMIILLSGIVTSAQTVDLAKGDLSILKDEKKINVEIAYDPKMTVGDDGKEADYIKRKRTELNDKEQGSGEIWARKWEEGKATYPPKFILGFTNLSGMTVSADAKYTLILNVKAMEPGYQAGISKKNAGIDGNITIVETANRDKKLIVLNFERPGSNMFRGAAFDPVSRIADAFYQTGQKVGKFIKKGGE
jgi:hypothetical protein